MSELTRLHDEAARFSEICRLYKDGDDLAFRRRAHLDLDKFLMEHRETAIICMEQVLTAELKQLKEVQSHMNLQEMPEWALYELYDALDCLKTLDSDGARLIYCELMK